MSELLQLVSLPALLGLLFIEGIYITRGIKRDASPDHFSFRYYMRQPRNITMLLTNVIGVAGLLYGHAEVVSIVVDLLEQIPMLQGKLAPDGYPVLTGMAIGLFGPLFLRFATRWIGEKLPSKDNDQRDGTGS